MDPGTGLFLAPKKRIHLGRELQLILVYICLVVVARFTFFPFGTVNGKIQPLHFDPAYLFPPRINLVPIGIIWPSVFPKLNTPAKVLAAGAGFSLFIEILQLPFFERLSDIDDLILNSLGYMLGYFLYLLAKFLIGAIKKCEA